MNGASRTQEGAHIRIPMVVSALTMTYQVAGKAARDAIFLSQFRIGDLPAMVMVAAITAIAASIVFSRMSVRLGPHRVATVSFALSSLLQFAEWLFLGYNTRVVACLIYLHVAAFGAVLLSLFWSVMNESFEPRSAKAVFGRVSGIGTLGGFCGGLLAERVAAWFGTGDVILLLAALHLACAGLLWRGAPDRDIRVQHRVHETSPLDAVHRYPFLLGLAGLVVTASTGSALLDFVFKAQAAQTLGPGAPLLRFFGAYYTATSLLTFLTQTFLTKFCVQRAGLANTTGSLPAFTSLGSITALLLPGFPALAGVRAIEIVMRAALYRSGYELFYTAVAPADKRAVKSVIDVGADRAGDAIGAAGVSLMLILAPGRHGPILALACAMSMIALLLAVRLRRGYLYALEKSLVERAIDLDPWLVEDSATRSVLMKSIEMRIPAPTASVPATGTPVSAPPAARDLFLRYASDLRSGDAARVTSAANELRADNWALAPLVIDLLAWDETMPAARDALERMGAKITGMLIDALLDPERDFVIRRRLPRVLAFLPSTRSVEGLVAALGDSRFEVRFYAGRALYLLLKEHPGLSVPAEVVWTAVNQELSLQRSVWNSHSLLDHRDVQERQWFFDGELLDRADRNLEHLFTLMGLLLPEKAVRVAFRALHTTDTQLKGTALEYLESATPTETRQLLLPLLETDAEFRSRAAAHGGALEKLLATTARVDRALNVGALGLEARK
jgi:ATP/ADP translocase